MTSIANGAFYNTSSHYYTSISFPETVTYIESETLDRTTWFRNQPDGLVYAGKVAYKYKGTMPSDTHIDILEGTLGISGYAFCDSYGYGCSGLTSVNIPNSVKVIGTRTFLNCSDLTNITFPNGATRIMALAFHGTAWYKNQPDGLVYAGKVAYMYKGTAPEGTQVTIKQGTLAIAEYAFQDCGISSVTIPGSVVSIGEYAFLRCSLTSVSIPNSVTSIGGYYTRDEYVTLANGKTQKFRYTYRGCFDQCENLQSVTLGTGLTCIPRGAFWVSGLESVHFNTPTNIKEIAFAAFYGCWKLKNIIIPEGVETIGRSAFVDNTALTSIKIPSSLTYFDVTSLSRATDLKKIIVPSINQWCTMDYGNNRMVGSLNSAVVFRDL